MDLFAELDAPLWAVEIVMEGDPVAKGRPRFNGKTGTVYTPKKTASYENRLSFYASQAMRGRAVLTGQLVLLYDTYKEVPKSKPRKWREAALRGEIRPTSRPDWENLGKVIDACNKIVWLDDAQIVDGRVRKFYSDNPRIEIYVKEIGPAA